MVEKYFSGECKVSVIGVICDFMMVIENFVVVIDKMLLEDVKIVFFIIIEGGYNFDFVMGEFIVDNLDVLYDIVNFIVLKFVFGYLLVVLKVCKDVGIKLFIIMLCDNI